MFTAGTRSPVSISAYTRWELARVIARPILPTGRVGSPLPVRRVQVVPPSVDFQIPLPAPPLLRPQVCTSTCQNPANRIRGLLGSITRSEAPVLSLTNSTRSHVVPPSVVR